MQAKEKRTIFHIDYLGIVCLISLFLGMLFYFVGDYTLPGGANLFTIWAEALAKGHLPPQISQRDVGYPLLLFLTGYTVTGSFAGITLLQAVFAVMMPILIYLSFGDSFPRTAFFTALAATASLGSFQYMKWIHHDQAFIFFNVLTVYAFAKFARSQSFGWFYVLTFVVLASSLTRPAGNFVYTMLLPLAFMLRPKLSVHYLVAPVLFILAIGAYNSYRHWVFEVPSGERMPSYTGQQIFYNLYINSREEGVRLKEEELPHLRHLMDKLRVAVGPVPRDSAPIQGLIHTRNYSPDFRAMAFSDTEVERFIQRFLDAPNYEYFEVLSITAGFRQDKMFLSAAFEIAAEHPLYTARYIARNIFYYLFKPGYAHGRDNATPILRSSPVFFLITNGQGATPQSGIAEKGFHEAATPLYDNAPLWLSSLCRLAKNTWKVLYLPLNFISALLMLVAAVFWVGVTVRRFLGRQTEYFRPAIDQMAGPLLTSLVIFFYNACVSAAFAEPSYRYHYHTILFQIIAGGYGAVLLWMCLGWGKDKLLRPTVATNAS